MNQGRAAANPNPSARCIPQSADVQRCSPIVFTPAALFALAPIVPAGLPQSVGPTSYYRFAEMAMALCLVNLSARQLEGRSRSDLGWREEWTGSAKQWLDVALARLSVA